MYKVEIANTDKLFNKLGDIGNIDLTKALTKAAIIVESSAKLLCPVGDTGNLRNSITHEVENNQAAIGTNVEYAQYVEIGTGIFSSMGNGRQDRWSYQTPDGEWHSTIGQHPQPYLQPALDINKGKISSILNDEIKKELEQIAGR